MGDAGRLTGGGLRNTPSYSDQSEETSVVREWDKIQSNTAEEPTTPKESAPGVDLSPSKSQEPYRKDRVAEAFLRGNIMHAQWKAAPAAIRLNSKDVVDRHKGTDGKLDIPGLADDLSKIVRTPRSEHLIGGVFARVPEAQHQDLARELVKKLGDAGMKQLALTDVGRSQLDLIAGTLEDKDPKANAKQINTIRDIVKNGNVEEAVLNAVANPDMKYLRSSTVLNDIRKFGQTKGYEKLTDANRTLTLKMITTMSFYAAQNPKNSTARNTLDQFVNGKIRMEFAKLSAKDNLANALIYPGNDLAVQFNTADESQLTDKTKLTSNTAHEVNHLVNPKTMDGTRERFLSEYRGFYVEKTAVGENPPKSDFLLTTVKFLGKSGPRGDGYDGLRNLYLSDVDFANVIDGMINDLNKTPPVIPTPEEVRLKFRALPGGSKSVPLIEKSNMDNH